MRLTVRGGRVVDPASGIDRVADLHVAKGRVVGLGDLPEGFTADRVVDAAGVLGDGQQFPIGEPAQVGGGHLGHHEVRHARQGDLQRRSGHVRRGEAAVRRGHRQLGAHLRPFPLP